MRRALTVIAMAAVVVGPGLGLGVGLGGVAHAGDTSVSIVGVNQGYSPSKVTVGPGDTVTWTNRDPTPAPHNAICDDSCPEPFSSGDPGPTGTTGHYTFRYSGTYNYNCAVHPNMKGSVVVTGNVHPPAAAASASAGGPSSTTAASATGSGQSQSGSASAVANSGALATASAGSPSTPSAFGSSSSSGAAAGDVGKTPLPPVGQLSLPQPQVRVRQAASHGTPWWVLLPSSLVLLVAAAACALAWLGPRPLRHRASQEAIG